MSRLVMKLPLRKLIIASLYFSVTSISHAITVSWGAAQTNGLADANGTPLPVGNLVLLGSFGNLTPSQISTVSFATLEANFVNYDLTPHYIGDGAPVSGGTTPTSADAGFFFVGNDTNSSIALGLNGKTVYMWVLNAATMGTATQEGVFTAAFNGSTSQIRTNWVFPSDAQVPNTINPDLSDVVPYTTGTNIDRNGVIIGSFGIGGNSAATGVPFFNLSPIDVPEPSAYVLLGTGIVVLFGSVRLRRKC